MLNKIKKIASLTIVILLIAILIINLFLIKTGKKETDIFGYSTAVVLTGSMEPEISANDMIVIHEDENYKVGDVVAYNYGTMMVTHRIIKETDDGYITKGDANNAADPEIPKSSVVGKVIMVIPGGGMVMRKVTSPIGMLLLSLLIILIYFWPDDFLKKLLKGKNEENEEENKTKNQEKDTTSS